MRTLAAALAVVLVSWNAGAIFAATGSAGGRLQTVPTPPPDVQPPAQPDTRPSFAEFLNGIREEARTRGIRDEIVEAALSDVEEPMPVVIERDRAQAETVLSIETYLAQHVTAKVIRNGREAYAGHRDLLGRVAARYGVPPGVIVAIWGVESNFGRFSGVRPTIAALATLAWDPRRATFFRTELFNALEILNRGDIDLPRLRGSWAGAMGQVQFMPSSYLEFAQDFDGDGKRDIWSSPADVFASIANYLSAHGWKPDVSWGREVRVSRDAERRIVQSVARRNGSCVATRNMTAVLPVAEWTRLGVRTANGKPLPAATVDSALVSGASRHFLVTGNYDALLAYNCAHSYALSVALLADRVTGSGRIVGEPKAAGRGSHKKPSRRRD